jgi:hypothetical protein
MRIRFLRTTPSQLPDFPFQAGQIVHLPHLTPEFRQYLKEGAAEVLPPENGAETADLEPGERAVESRPKPRGKR